MVVKVAVRVAQVWLCPDRVVAQLLRLSGNAGLLDDLKHRGHHVLDEGRGSRGRRLPDEVRKVEVAGYEPGGTPERIAMSFPGSRFEAVSQVDADKLTRPSRLLLGQLMGDVPEVVATKVIAHRAHELQEEVENFSAGAKRQAGKRLCKRPIGLSGRGLPVGLNQRRDTPGVLRGC